jgi:hypothetical protein
MQPGMQSLHEKTVSQNSISALSTPRMIRSRNLTLQHISIAALNAWEFTLHEHKN